MDSGILSMIKAEFDVGIKDVRTVPSLALAYIGDCIYELVIRSILLQQGLCHVNELNKYSSNMAKAATQCEMFHAIENMLDEEELGVFRRGRNVKSSSVAKNASVTDYRTATGYEALLGYLYLNEKYDRILELIHEGARIHKIGK